MKNCMKRQFIVAALMSIFVSALFAENSIEAVIRRFDTVILNAAIPKAEVSIGFISYADTETCGTVVPWIHGEIKKAVTKMRRIKLVQSNTLNQQEQTGIATRGAMFGDTKKTDSKKEKYILSGKYYKNKAVMELTLDLIGVSGTLIASETAVMPLSEVYDRNLTLYPENKDQAETVKKDFEQAAAELQGEEQSSILAQETSDSSGASLSSQNETNTSSNKKDAIQVVASMLDKKNNLVDILYPGDAVKFVITTDKDAYIAIMGIDANGKQFWLPVKNNFLQAGVQRTFPDTDIEYQAVDGVFGTEGIIIYAVSDESTLPQPINESEYSSGTIQNITRGLIAVKKEKKAATGVCIIPYTVMKK